MYCAATVDCAHFSLELMGSASATIAENDLGVAQRTEHRESCWKLHKGGQRLCQFSGMQVRFLPFGVALSFFYGAVAEWFKAGDL